MRSDMNVRQQPQKVFFIKKKQVRELRPEYLSPVRQKRQPVNTDVKWVCLQIAQKYLSKSAVQFYRTLPSIKEKNLMKPWSRLAHSCRSLSPVSAARSISTPPGRDANPSQVIPSNLLGFPQKFAGTHLYSCVERGTVRVKCPRTQHSEPGPLGLGMSTLTMRPTCLHKRKS